MSKTEKKLAFWEKVVDIGAAGLLVSFIVMIVTLILFLLVNAFGYVSLADAGNFSEALFDTAMWIFDNILNVLIGGVFVVYFVLFVLLQFIGINIGPRN